MKMILKQRLPFLSQNTSVGQFSNTEQYKVCQAGTFDWSSLRNRFFHACPKDICLLLELLLPVTGSIRDFLPAPADRKENSVFCCFIVKLNMNNKHALLKKWLLSRKNLTESQPKISLVQLWSLKGISTLHGLILLFFIYTFTRIEYRIHWYKKKLELFLFFYLLNSLGFQVILGGKKWCYRQ